MAREIENDLTYLSVLKDSPSLFMSTYSWCSIEETPKEREGEVSFFPLWMWATCLDKNRTVEIASFFLHIYLLWKCTFAFLHLTWWLHHFPEGTEYISESEHSTGFLPARKQQLQRRSQLTICGLIWSGYVFLAKHYVYIQIEITVTGTKASSFGCQVWQSIVDTIKIEKIFKANGKTDMLRGW